MTTFSRGLIVICLIASAITLGLAQYPEDALRLSTPGLALGARSLGMGSVWTGSANDFSAMYTNPAGLGQIRTSEVSVGLSNLSYNNTSTLNRDGVPVNGGNSTSYSNSSTSINNIGFVYPFPTVRGSMVFAAGYNKNSDFTTGLSYNVFNPVSSIIPTLDPTMGYQLYLQDSTGATPIQDSVQQKRRVIEGGGVNNWTVAGSVEAARDLYLGLALTFVSGSYEYTSTHTETDAADKYNPARFGHYMPGNYDYAFSQFMLSNTVNSDIGGFTAKVGMVYRPNDQLRVGVSLKLPTYYTIQENYTNDGTSTFDTPDANGNSQYTYNTDGRTEYDVHTPFVFNGGLSYELGNLLLAGDVDYTDWTQMSFANADPTLEAYNADIKERFQATANLRVGAEYEFGAAGLRLRGGYAYLPSPYKGDPSDFAQKYITAGVGFIVENSVAFDIGYAYGTYNNLHLSYTENAPSNRELTTSEKVKTNTIIGTVSYRF